MVVATVIGFDVVLEDAVVTEAGNAGCTIDVPDVRDTLVVEETIEIADVVVADVAAVARVGDDALT